MLKLLLQGTALNLPPDFQLNLIYENPLFLNDRIPAVHSLTFTLPPTPHNLALLGNPDRIASTRSFREYEGLEVLFGPVKFLQGILIVTKFDKDIKLFFRGSTYPDEIQAQLNETTMERYDFGEGLFSSLDFSDPDNFGYKYTQLMLDSLDSTENFATGPVRVKDEEWPDIEPDEYPTDSGILATNTMYLNYFNAYDENFLISGVSEDYHGVIFPSPFVSYIVDLIFGDRLLSNPFHTGDFSKLVFCNFFHSEYGRQLLFTTDWFIPNNGILLDPDPTIPFTERFFDLNSFSSSMPVNDMLKEILKIVGGTLYTRGNDFEILFNNDVITATEQVNWTDKLLGKLAHWKEDAKTYLYGYAGIDDNPDISELTDSETIDDLQALTPAEDVTTTRYITTTNQVIAVRLRDKADPGDADRYSYEVVSGGYGGRQSGDNGYSVVSDIIPLDVNIHDYWWEDTGSPITFGQWYVPEWSGDRMQIQDRPFIMLFHGLQDTLSDKDGSPGTLDKYPCLSGHNIDAYGNKLSDFSLQWEGEEGLLETFHKEFKEWIEEDKIYAEGDFLLSVTDLKNLDMSIKRHVKSKNFFIEKLEVTISSNKINPARANLIEAPYNTPDSGSA